MAPVTWWAPTALVAGSLYEIAASGIKRNKAPKTHTTSNIKVEGITLPLFSITIIICVCRKLIAMHCFITYLQVTFLFLCGLSGVVKLEIVCFKVLPCVAIIAISLSIVEYFYSVNTI
jgi:hypothetical protein